MLGPERHTVSPAMVHLPCTQEEGRSSLTFPSYEWMNVQLRVVEPYICEEKLD